MALLSPAFSAFTYFIHVDEGSCSCIFVTLIEQFAPFDVSLRRVFTGYAGIFPHYLQFIIDIDNDAKKLIERG